MRHLFNSVVSTYRVQQTNQAGIGVFDYVPMAGELSYVKCRLDLSFLRPGRDAPPPIEAGKALDRFGVLFCDVWVPFKAGDRIRTVNNDVGEQPVEGWFELRHVPDRAIDFSRAHHIEVQIVEVAQAVAAGYPGVSN